MTPSLAAAAFALLLAAPPGTDTPDSRKAAPPPAAADDDDRNLSRIAVGISFWIIDFARLNTREETFELEAVVELTWNDPTLVSSGQASKGRERHLKPSEAWTPTLEYLNAVDAIKLKREGDLHVSPNGDVVWRVRIDGKFSAELDLHRFPFDSQSLYVAIAAVDQGGMRVDLHDVVDRSGRSEYAFLSDWSLQDVRTSIDATEGVLKDISHNYLLVDIRIARRSSYYIWRVLLPMAMLVIAASSVFWFDPTNLQPLISTALGILLSLVTFNFSADFALPKVERLTFIDRFALTSFAFVGIAIALITAIHWFIRKNRLDHALRIQTISRVAFPVSYLLIQLLWAAVMMTY